MEKEKKIKIILATIYLFIISIFLWVFFSYYSLNELTSFEFIKNNRDHLIELKNNNYFFVISLFFLMTILWVLFLGFGSPVSLLGGFMFGKWVGTFIVAIGLSIGATFLYLLSNYFLKDIVRKNFSKRFNSLSENFKKNEFIYFLIYRFIGGIPFAISNIVPTLFNIKTKNFLFGSILGLAPQIFILVSLGSGIEKIIDKNIKIPSFFEIIFSREIYIPIISFFLLLILGIIVKNIFIKK